MISWMKEQVVSLGMMNDDELTMFQVVDTADEAVKHIMDFYKKYTGKSAIK